MTEELQNLVRLGAAIRTDGRWNDANEGIKWVAANISSDDSWEWQVVAGLFRSLFSEFIAIEKAHQSNENRASPRMAWHARNLLELQVWATYCSASREHSRRLYEDAGRDAVGILKSFSMWGAKVGQPDDWLKQLNDDQNDLRDQAATEGVVVDGSFLSVFTAAQACGLEQHFWIGNKFFSKFAHPTALVICGQYDPEAEAGLKDYAFAYGSWFFAEAFDDAMSMLIRVAKQCGLDTESQPRG